MIQFEHFFVLLKRNFLIHIFVSITQNNV